MKGTVSKLISFCVVAAMILGCTACSTNAGTPAANPTTNPATAAPTTAPSTPAPTPTPDPYALPSLPLANPVTITALNIERKGFDPNCIIAKELEKRTGVTLNCTWVAGADFATKQNVSLAAGIKYDFTILTTPANKTTKELASELGRQGMVLKLNDYIKNMPNLNLMLGKYPSWTVQAEDSDGSIYIWPQPSTYLGSFTGKMLYYCWNVSEEAFNAQGLKDPTTIDELTSTLQKLKTAYPDSYPLLTINLGAFASAFGVGTVDKSGGLFWNPDTNQYEIAALNPKFRDAIAYAHQLYADKLLDPEFATMSGDQLNDKLINNKGFIYWGFTGDTFVIGDQAKTVNPNFGLHSIDPLSYNGNQGKYECYGGGSLNLDWVGVIDASSPRKEALLSYLDYQLSEECINLISWGIEGTTYQVVNGQPQYLPSIKTKANPSGTVDVADYFSTTNIGIGIQPTVEFYSSVSMGWDQKSTEKMMYFSANADKLCQEMPNFSIALTADESQTASSIKTQLKTYLDENIIKFITGDIELNDANWTNFVNTVKGLGTDQLTKIYNDALARAPKW